MDTQSRTRLPLSNPSDPRLKRLCTQQQFECSVLPFEFLLAEQGVNLPMAVAAGENSLFAVSTLGNEMMFGESRSRVSVFTDHASTFMFGQ